MKPGITLAIVILVLVAIAHLIRLIYGAQVTVEGTEIPQWVSVLGIIVPALIAFLLWRESKT